MRRFVVPVFLLGLLLSLEPGRAVAASHTVTNTNDSGPGSLRQAIADADADPGGSVVFSVGSGVKTIRPLTALTSSSAIIDGTSQPGFAGSPLIEIDGSLLPAITPAINMSGGLIRALVVNRSNYAGILLSGLTGTVRGCYVGTDPSGQTALGNGAGIYTYVGNYTIGGTGPGEGNLISGNGYGIYLQGSGSRVLGNRIGTNAAGAVAIPNLNDGVFVTNASPTIGGTAPGEGNLISGNGQYGVEIFYANDVVVQGNTIGPNSLGQNMFSNQRAGVDIYQSSRAAVEQNTIAFHTFAGIAVEFGATRNRFSQNSLFSNAFGIDLDFLLNQPGSRVTPNDACDTDSGPNLQQNFPVITSVSRSGGSVSVRGTLNAEPSETFNLEFFSTASCNSSGYGEGQTYLGSTTVTTDGSCNALFAASFALPEPSQTVITATATDPFGNTSEFSACVMASGGGGLIPDGRAVLRDLDPAGDTFSADVLAGLSYSVEVDTPFDGAGTLSGGGPSASVTVTRSDGSTPLATPPIDRSSCAPAAPARLTFTPAQADLLSGPLQIRVADASSSAYPFRIRLIETSLFCPRWSTNGYNALIDLQNISDCPVSGQVLLLGSSGAMVTALPFSLSPAGATQVSIPTGLSPLVGSARLTHDGPSDSIVAGTYMIQPGSSGVAFRWPFKEVRSYGATDGR